MIDPSEIAVTCSSLTFKLFVQVGMRFTTIRKRKYAEHDKKKSMVVLMPVLNDWQSIAKLLSAIDNAVAALNMDVSVFVIFNGGTNEAPIYRRTDNRDFEGA